MRVPSGVRCTGRLETDPEARAGKPARDGGGGLVPVETPVDRAVAVTLETVARGTHAVGQLMEVMGEQEVDAPLVVGRQPAASRLRNHEMNGGPWADFVAISALVEVAAR